MTDLYLAEFAMHLDEIDEQVRRSGYAYVTVNSTGVEKWLCAHSKDGVWVVLQALKKDRDSLHEKLDVKNMISTSSHVLIVRMGSGCSYPLLSRMRFLSALPDLRLLVFVE